MPRTKGFVGTVEVETRNVSRIWFSLTAGPNDDDWVKIGAHRAWFTLNLESSERPFYLSELPLIMESMRTRIQIQVSHEGAAAFEKRNPGDSFEVNGVRILRHPMRFS